jgi:hypothetical protein
MRNFTNYDNLTSSAISDRGITYNTSLAYGVKQDDTKHYYPYYDSDNFIAGLKVRSVADKQFNGYALGSCAQMLDLPTLGNTKYIYTYRASGDLDTNYLANEYIKYISSYEVMGKVYPIINIELPTYIKVNDILLSCPGIHPPLSKIITQDRLR